MSLHMTRITRSQTGGGRTSRAGKTPARQQAPSVEDVEDEVEEDAEDEEEATPRERATFASRRRTDAAKDVRRLGTAELNRLADSVVIESEQTFHTPTATKIQPIVALTTFILALAAGGFAGYLLWHHQGFTWTSGILTVWAFVRLRRGLQLRTTSSESKSASSISSTKKDKTNGKLSSWLLGDDEDEKPCFTFTLLNRLMHEDVNTLNDLLRKPDLYVKKAKKGGEYEDAKLPKEEVLLFDHARISVDAPRAYVFEFNGDGHASQVEQLRQFVTLVVGVARPGQDRAVLLLNSPGGEVSAYGLAAVQVARLRDADIDVVACVDRCAASGGYMMCAPATFILAAPFAWIGSIGVVCETPNVNRFMKHHNVDYHLFTAGKHKRTVTLMGPVTNDGIQHMQEQMNKIHRQFSEWVGRFRVPRLPRGMALGDVATGDSWSATEAKKLGLVDEIGTSDDYIEQLKNSHVVVLVEPYHSKWDKLVSSRRGDTAAKLSTFISDTLLSVWQTVARPSLRG